MADKFSTLGLNDSMTYQEIKSALVKQKKTWTMRESNGTDKIRRDAEAMTDLISQLRDFLAKIPESSDFPFLALETYAFFLEKDFPQIEALSNAILQADSGDMEAKI